MSYMWKRYLDPAACSFENGKCTASIMENSAIKIDEIIDAGETKTVRKNITC